MNDLALSAANSIAAALEQLGLPVPKATATALATYNAATAAVFGNGDAVDLEALLEEATPDTIASIIHGIGMASLEREAVKKGAGPDVVSRLARRVTRSVRADGPGILDALAPLFRKAAATFTKAVGQLPDRSVDSTVLVAAGPDAVRAFGVAGEARRTMSACYLVRQNLASLGVSAGTGRLELGTRCAKVTDVEAGEIAAEAMQTTGALSPFLDLLAIPGVELAWPTIEEQAAHIASLRQPAAA